MFHQKREIFFFSGKFISFTYYQNSKSSHMKNFIFALALGLLAIATPVLAQKDISKAFKLKSEVAGKSAVQAQKDTATNAVEKAQSVRIPGVWSTVSVQAFLRKLSGTPAGKVYFEGSLTGASNSWDKADSVTVLNVANQTKIFNVTPSKYVFYRIRFAGSGTQSTEFSSLAVARN